MAAKEAYVGRELVGLIGYPLTHSVSPAFQQAAFDYYCLPIRYEVWEVSADAVEEAIRGLRRPGYLGANVTIPFKEKVLPWLDEVDEQAARIGAVNTIVNRGGRLAGYNTDADGFLEALDRDAGFDPYGQSAVIVGAGGAARAVLVALLDAGASSITVVNRHLERAEKLVADFSSEGSGAFLAALSPADARLGAALARCDLLVNATSVGMKRSRTENASPLDARLLPETALVFDLVYNPLETRLLAMAKAHGCQILNGLPMLVYQGALAFELWTGKKAPIGLMLERARQALT